MNSGGPSPRWEIGEVRSGGVGGGGWLSLFVLYLIIFCVALVSALFVLFQDTIPVLGVREVYASVELGGGSYSFISYVHNVHFHHLHWLLLAALVLSCVAASFKVGAEAEYGRFRSYVVGYGAFLVSVVLYFNTRAALFADWFPYSILLLLAFVTLMVMGIKVVSPHLESLFLSNYAGWPTTLKRTALMIVIFATGAGLYAHSKDPGKDWPLLLVFLFVGLKLSPPRFKSFLRLDGLWNPSPISLLIAKLAVILMILHALYLYSEVLSEGGLPPINPMNYDK